MTHEERAAKELRAVFKEYAKGLGIWVVARIVRDVMQELLDGWVRPDDTLRHRITLTSERIKSI
jgi:hypothetical protein